MALPCPKCGGTKTDPVSHGLKYNLAWAFGYRLRQCSRCRTSRYIPRNRGRSPGSSQSGKEPVNTLGLAEEGRGLGSAEAPPDPREDQATAEEPRKRELPLCPACGATRSHHTHRTIMERLLHRPAMARCESCGMRFPRPRLHAKYVEPLKVLEPGAAVPRSDELKKAPSTPEEKTQAEVPGEAATVSPSAGEREAPKMAEEKTQPKAVNQGATVSNSVELKKAPGMGAGIAQPEVNKQVPTVAFPEGELRTCPACGSTKSHRTRRTTMERLLQRPPMARCEDCGLRFPYFKNYDKSLDSVRPGEALPSASWVGDEDRWPRGTEETSQPNVDKQGSAAVPSKREPAQCPFCGSTSFQRSRRSTLEHLLLRPKMARCRNCHKRFPYPHR